jgi:glycosyltransferase involved in cell wall biosynthesis
MTGEYSTPEFRERFTQQAREAAERSDLIIAVSAFTAGQVESLLGIPRSRIRVVHHGVDPAAERSPLTDKIILFVGAIQKRKNVLRLVEAFERTQPGWKLVLAGSAGYGAQEIRDAIARSPRRSDIEMCGYVTAAALEQWYRTASIFAFPSLDEGFGIPVLEAMAHGIPVLTSDSSALREVAGDAALLVEANDSGAIANGLNLLLRNETIRRHLGQRGLERCAKFTWDQAVRKTWDVYRELLD